MKLVILLLLSLVLCTFSSSAQSTYSIKGAIVDTSSNAKLVNASVLVLNAKDSIMRTFIRTGPGGIFNIEGLKKGKLILLVTYPGYADYVEHFTLDSTKTTRDFGKINLFLKAKLLADVIVKGTRAAIKIKGDTTEFDPRAYSIQPNAKVEDLLKQLPGIQVDKDGKITAQGQTISKVLVDGEEFFGDDPTLVTKNLRADMVDKVQLYDKKSDQATFTGVDDGQKTKTINIKLKEDKKNGYFGKVDAGIGTDGYYEGQVLFNKFKAKQKFSVYGTVGNDGKTGLGWQDSQKYGSDSNVQFGDDGGIFISFSGSRDELDSFDGQYSGQGIPIARTGGVHYDTKWNGDKESINGNYKIGSLTVDGTNTSLTQNNTAEGAINGATDQVYHNYLFRQKMDATYTIKLDTTSNLKISVDGTLKNGQTRSNYTSSNTRGNGILQNTSDRNVLNNTTGQLFDMTAFYTKKFKKKGRTISLTVSESNNKTTAKGYLKSEADFFDDKGKQDSTQKVDQYKTSITNSNIFNTNIAYTEPLAKSLTVVFNYGLGINNGTSVRRSFDQSTPGNYNIQVDSLSNSYKLNELSNQVGAIFNYKKKKTTINLGTKVSDVHYDQMNEFTDMPFKRSFINWNPQATFQYQFSQRKSFRISYYGNTTQPTIDQIQPVIVNTDPLNTVLGNQDLRPSFANRFNINYNSYKVLTDQFISFYGNYSFTSNPIVSSLTIDSAGKTTNRYINLNKKPINYYLSAYFEKKVSKFGINVGLSGDVSGSTSYSLSNNDLNRTKYNNYAVQLRLSKYKENKYDFSASFGPNYTVSGSSLQSQINNNGRGFTSNDSFNIYLPGKFQIGSDVSYQFTAKTETFNQDFKRTLWNANISKTFLKANNLKASIAGNDLLNQNVGFSRSVSGNYISQNNYTTIKRYFMLSLIWDFNKVGGGAPKK